MKNQPAKIFEEILEINKDRIYRICKIYSVHPLDPQDLFQDVVFEIWKSFSSFKDQSNISTWIYKITLNVCLRSRQKSARENNKLVRLESIEFIPQELPQGRYQQEKYNALTSCISSLEENSRAIIILHLEELPYKDIAVITGLTENHIAVKMKRIKKLLLNCITNKL